MKKAVKLKDRGESGRILEIEINSKKASTPARAVHQVERRLVDTYFANYSSSLTLNALPPCEIQETVLDFNENSVMKLQEKNGKLRERAGVIARSNRNRQSCLKIATIRMKQGTKWNPEAIELLTLAQKDAKCLDLISVPDPCYNGFADFNIFDAYKKARDTLDQRGLDNVQIMPNLDLRTEPSDIQEKISGLVSLGVEALSFRFRPGAYASILRVSKLLSSEDIWVHLSDVQKSMVDGTVPAIHIQPLYCFDSISSHKYYGPPTRSGYRDEGKFAITSLERPSPDDMAIQQEIIDIRAPSKVLTRFDASVLGIFNKQQHKEIIGSNLNCDCALCRNKTVDSFFSYGLMNGKVSIPTYRVHHTVHELWASQNEFISCRPMIVESGYNEYLLHKLNISSHQSRIFGLVPHGNLLDYL